MNINRKPTTAMVIPIDFSPEIDGFPEWWLREKPDDECPTEFRMADAWGYVLLPDGGIYLVCTEGVDRVPEYDGNYVLGVLCEWDRTTPEQAARGERSRSIAAGAVASVVVSADEIKALPAGDPVNLADFIRRFGPRLENNYDLHRKALAPLLGGAA